MEKGNIPKDKIEELKKMKGVEIMSEQGISILGYDNSSTVDEKENT